MFLHGPLKLQRYLKLPLLTIIGILSIIIAVGGIYLEMTGVHERKPLTPRPLPSKYLPEADGEDVLVISGIPLLDNPSMDIHRPSWREVEEALPELKEIGVNVIFLWAPYERAEPVDKIVAYTSEGEVQLNVKWWVKPKNFLKPDPERGSEKEFLRMIKTAHSLGIKVLPQLCILTSIPGDFIYEEHPEWILKSIYGKPAVTWPWATSSWGYVINKAHPELIKYVTEVLMPHWIKDWGADGIFLDAPGIIYCDLHLRDMLRDLKEKGELPSGFECLTPVNGYYSPEPLVRAMRAKIDELKRELGRDLIFASEHILKTWQDLPDDLIMMRIKKRDPYDILMDPRMNRSLGKYFDWIWGYGFRIFLKRVYCGGDSSYSENYVKYFELERNLNAKYTEIARFITMLNDMTPYVDLLKPKTAGCYITLTVTAPGRIIWIGIYQLPPQNEKVGMILGWNSSLLKDWYARLIALKRAYPALQSDNIENALIKPSLPRLIAYNRWLGNQSLTVLVNANESPVTAYVKTRFRGETITLIDLISAEKIRGDPKNLRVEMPPYSARILAIKTE